MPEAKRTLYDSSRTARWKKGGPVGTTMAQVVVVGHDEPNRENWTGRLSLLFPFVMKCNTEVPPERQMLQTPYGRRKQQPRPVPILLSDRIWRSETSPCFRDFDIVHRESLSSLPT